VALVDGSRLRLAGAWGPLPPETPVGALLAPAGDVGSIIASFVTVGDVTARPWPAGHPAGVEIAAAAFMSAPIHGTGGRPIGCLCVVDRKPRTWSSDEADLLAELSASIGASIELHSTRRNLAELDIASRSVTPVKLSEEALRYRTAVLEEQAATGDLLKAIAVASNEATTRMQVLQSCLDRVCAHMRWAVGHAYLVSCNRLVPASLWHLTHPDEHRPFREASEVAALASDRGLAGRALSTGQPTWSTNLASDLEYLRAAVAKRAGLRSGLALPILVQGEVLAVLEFYSDQGNRPSDRVLSVMAEVTSQLGRVFEREKARSMLEEHAEQVRAKSLTDELTSLHNRRGFFEAGPERLHQANGDARGVALFFVDLNGMKLINDQFGHEWGDRALVDTADLLRETFGPGALIARLGGDEFAVVASHESPDELKALRSRLQGRIDALNASRRRPYRLSASVGAAIYEPGENATFEELISRADTLMYEHKRKRLLYAGRRGQRIERAPSGSEPAPTRPEGLKPPVRLGSAP
jgi:diguanylate cyclase (GGDEF)-like protein